jgi:hypothetical protein
LTQEGRIKAACLWYLERRGIFAWNNPTGATQIAPNRWIRFGLKGSSDILGVLPGGRFMAIETKSKGGRLSSEQSAFLERIRGSGGVAVVVRSWQELDVVLRREGYVNDGTLFEDGPGIKPTQI